MGNTYQQVSNKMQTLYTFTCNRRRLKSTQELQLHEQISLICDKTPHIYLQTRQNHLPKKI